MSDNIELNPCPFCGGKPDLHSKDTPTGVSYVECVECGVQMGGDDDAEALELWNNRHEGRCDEANKPSRVGIVNMGGKSWEQLMTIGKSSHIRVFHGNALYSQLMEISIALQDISSVRHETAEIIASGVEKRVFGIVASLLGIDDKGGEK